MLDKKEAANNQGNQRSTDDAANGQGSKDAETKSLYKWCDFMETMLGCIDNENVEACSISLVPHHLRNSKAEAYMPHVVSIGPLHKGKRTDLLYMEEIKWRCMLHLLHRSEYPMQVLRKCCEAMLDLDEIVRASYNVDEIKFGCDDLSKIMVLDGCFLLELLISGSVLNDKIECSLNVRSPGHGVIQREKVLSDLTMLENQIPFLVLRMLSQKLFPDIFKDETCTRLIHEHALSILGYDYGTLGSSCEQLKAFHLLELVESFIDKEKVKDTTTNASEINIDSREDESGGHTKVKLQRFATRLEAVGVTIAGKINAQTEDSNIAAKSRFDLKVRFSKGKLEIPPLHVTETTKAKWRNFIAWELNRTTLEKQRGRREARISCQFISYAWFIQSLICCVHDVKLLRDRKVIFAREVESEEGKKKTMSNEDLMNLFRSLTVGIPDSEIDTDAWFDEVVQKLNTYAAVDNPTATCKIIIGREVERSKIMWHILRCFVTWIWYICRGSYRALRRDYIPTGWGLIAVLAAGTGLALTAVQTHYSIHQ